MSSKSDRDLDAELLKFEEEISKLSAETAKPSNTPVIISAAPVSNLTVKPSSNFQLPTFVPAPATNFGSALHFQPTSISRPNTFSSSVPNAANLSQPLLFKPSQVMKSTNDSNFGVKRDAAGNALVNNTKSSSLASKGVPNSAAANSAISAGAASSGIVETSTATKEPKKKVKKIIRSAGGQTWEDETLNEWDNDDYRLFCGDLGNEVSDELLTRAFQKYPSFQKAKVVRDKRTQKTKGYGFVSFKDSSDFIKAMREMNGKYVGNRPIKLRKSNWRDRNLENVKKKEIEKQKMGLR